MFVTCTEKKSRTSGVMIRRVWKTCRVLAVVGVAGGIFGCAAMKGDPLKAGMQLESQGKYQEAVASYEAVAAQNAGKPVAYAAEFRMADAYQNNLNEPEKALSILQKIAAAEPTGPNGLTARYKMGLYYYKAEDFDTAATTFNKIVNEAPTTKQGADSQLMLAKTYEKAKKFEEAEKTYAAFTQLRPEDSNAAVAMINRAKLLEQLGKREEAVRTLQKVVKDYGAKEELSEQVKAATEQLKLQGESVPKPTTAQQAAVEGRPRTAREAIQATREKRMTDSAKQEEAERKAASVFGVDAETIMTQMNITYDSQGTKHDAMYQIGVMMYQDEKYREAGALYQRAIELSSQDTSKGPWENLGNAYKGLADVYTKLGMAERAREFLLQAYRKDSGVLDQIIEGSKFDYAAGDYEKAIQTWTTVLGINPGKDAEIYNNIGLAYQKLKDVDNEVAYFERAVAANPGYKDALKNLVEVLFYRAGQRNRAYAVDDIVKDKSTFAGNQEIASLCLRYGYNQNAQFWYGMAERSAEKPEDKVAMGAMKAVAQVRKGGTAADEGATAFNAILSANPGNARVQYAGALVALAQKDNAKAEAAFKKSLELDSKLGEAANAWADMHLAADNEAAAVKVLEDYVAANPQDRSTARRRDMLKGVSATIRAVPPPAPRQP